MRILIAMSDTGGGHRAVSNAVAEAIRDLSDAEVSIVDLFAYGERRLLMDRVTRLYGPVIRVEPRIYGAAYAITNRRATDRLIRAIGDRPLRSRARQLLADEQPDIVVSIHSLVTLPIMRAIAQDRPDLRTIVVVPDLVTAHRSWVVPGVYRYTVPTEEQRSRLLRFKVPDERIVLTGLPVGKAFSQPVDRAAVQASLGLNPRRLTVLVVGGGEGSGNLPSIVDAIDDADLPIQLIVVCGKNAAARDRLLLVPPATPAAILGFARNMPELVGASDIVITKGGPQSIVESLVAGKPVLVTQVLPGQEQGNDRYVERYGAGFAVGSRIRLINVLSRLVRDDAERAEMAANARALGQPDAATKVARVILDSVA